MLEMLYKIGVTKNTETRLFYYRKEYPEFKFIKVFETKHPYLIESMVKENYYKDGFSNYGSEWYEGLTEKEGQLLIDSVKEIIRSYQVGDCEVFGFDAMKKRLKKGFVYVGVTNRLPTNTNINPEKEQ